MTHTTSNQATRPLPAALTTSKDLRWFVGIEDTCVYPRPADSFAALDEHILTGHDRQRTADFDRVAALGVDGIRYGMSWPTVHTGPGRYQWDLLDPALAEAQERGLHVIADLVHYGCPPWLPGSFVDDGFVPALTEFALALVDRYGDAIGSITPINEPLTTASFCGLRSIWPPAIGSKHGWADVAASLAEATQSVVTQVRAVAPHIAMVHVEAAHLYETSDPTLEGEVAELDMLGDLATDLVVGLADHDTAGAVWLREHGIDETRLQRIIDGAVTPDLLGVNYYPDLTPRVLARHGDKIQQITVDRWATGLASVVRHSAERYKLPVLVTETSVEGDGERRAAWLQAATTELRHVRSQGIDVRGLTWWPLIDFIDWSYIAEGASVEEFVTGAIDPTTNELVGIPIESRDRAGGVEAFARRMGLFNLDADGAGRSSTAAAALLTELAQSPSTTGVGQHHPSGRLGSNTLTEVALTDGWTLSHDAGPGQPINVPALWESLGYVGLDGTVRYRTTFPKPEPDHRWTLRFDAVMDTATVELNGSVIGSHDLPYTPFEFDVSGMLRAENSLVVDVTDPPAGSAEHLSSAHGKQGWANHEFPSPPSLYLTYGGIWQPVTLRSHGNVVIRDVSCNLDPKDTIVTVEIEHLALSNPSSNGARDCESVDVRVDIGGHERLVTIPAQPGTRSDVEVKFEAPGLDHWSPSQPTLHPCRVRVSDRFGASDETTIDIGLRTVGVVDGRLSVNGEPTLARSALVQGFHAQALYAEGTDQEIEDEILQAKALGFNMLRLHLRPFDPRYLDACDRLGMLLHCDVSIAEPIQHDQLDDVGPLARACAAAVTAQIRRDRSHPSIVLWSTMNEIGIDRPSLRGTARYERFVRLMVDTLLATDTTRPYIENDWIDPDTERVFRAPLATAHWYGHLDRAYLTTLETRCESLRAEPLPVAITELGDWGLPHPDAGSGRFYAHRTAYEQMLAETWWPGTFEEFSAATQEYQGIADRLQIDTVRRSGASAGYCLTELTDVPWEFNGVLDVDRNPKTGAAPHIAAANKEVSPILSFSDFGATAGAPIAATATVVNDSPTEISIEATIDYAGQSIGLGSHTIASGEVARLPTPDFNAVAGADQVTISVRDTASGTTRRSTYPVVVHRPIAPTGIVVRPAGAGAEAFIESISWTTPGSTGPLLVGENELTACLAEVDEHLEAGGVAIVLAQDIDNASRYPGVDRLCPIRSEWGGTPFRYTTDTPMIAAFPPRSVLHIHDADIAPNTIAVPSTPPDHIAVGVFKPLPRPATGLVLGSIPVGSGTVIVCQYRLSAAAHAATTASAVFADVVSYGIRLADQRQRERANQ